jgi:hypothetical protein
MIKQILLQDKTTALTRYFAGFSVSYKGCAPALRTSTLLCHLPMEHFFGTEHAHSFCF